MLKLLFAFLIIIHGLIHLLGFAKEWRFATVSQLTGKTLVPLPDNLSKAAGLLWLLACMLFLGGASAYLLIREWWWIPSAAALAVSQILIIIYWRDAKFGTVANIIILLATVLSYGAWSFNKNVKHELKNLLLQPPRHKKEFVTEAMLADLPKCIQTWLKRSNAIGKEMIRDVHLLQKGEMRTREKGKWMPVEAEQYITVERPAFIWQADFQAAPFVHISGRDKYENGKGSMLIKLFSLISIADSRGRETDQGSLLRFLGEIVWYPTAAMGDYITWEEIDSVSAKATMTYGGVSASGIFRFTLDGDVISFEADRYYDRNGKYTLEKWLVSVRDYKEFEGIRVPTETEVTWKLEKADFTWYRFKIVIVEYNRASTPRRI